MAHLVSKAHSLFSAIKDDSPNQDELVVISRKSSASAVLFSCVTPSQGHNSVLLLASIVLFSSAALSSCNSASGSVLL